MNKKKTLIIVCILAFAGTTTMIASSYFFTGHHYTSRKQKSETMPASEAGGYLDYIRSVRANQVTGSVDLNDVLRAETQANTMTYNKTSTLMKWKEVGPDNIGGRTRAILFDKNNPDRMYAGAVSGGLWISDDAGANWKIFNDTLQNLIVSCITQAANGDIYFGTGEYSYRFTPGDENSGFQGRGVWKSTDNGKTFVRLPSTWDALNVIQKQPWQFVNQIIADPNNSQRIYAATWQGFRLSNDGGATWIIPKQKSGIAVSGGIASDVQVASDGTVIVFVGISLYKSSNGDDGTYTKVSFTGGYSAVNLRFAISPSNPNYMYCSAADASFKLKNIYQSTDKGDTWQVIGPGGSDAFSPFSSTNPQGDYDNAITVDPSNPQRIFLGGVDFYSWSSTTGWLEIANQGNFPSNQYYVHADKHTIKFHPKNPKICFIGTDGGIFRTKNASDVYPTYQPMNKGYRVTQFYSVAFSSDGKDVIGGTQDNGTQYIDGKGNSAMSSHDIFGGDGVYTNISVINPSAFFMGIYYGGLSRSSNKGITSAKFYDSIMDNAVTTNKAAFVTPFLLWENLNDSSSPDSILFTASPVTQQNIDVGDGVKVKFTGTLSLPQQSAKLSAVEIRVDNMLVKDDGNGNLTGDVSSSVANTVNYTTGAYNFTFKTAPAKGMLIKTNYNVSYDAGATIKIKSATGDFPFLYTLPNTLNSNSSTKIQDVVQAKFAVGINNSVWLTKGALNFKTTPRWFKIANINGQAHCMGFSKDGNSLFVGVTGSNTLYRITGLSSIGNSQDNSGNKYDLTTSSGIGQVKDEFTQSFSQTITDVSFDPNDNNRAVITLGNYGNVDHVFLSTNALDPSPTFSSIQHNLPYMPVYDALIDKTNSSRILLATDLGVWTSEDNGTTWSEQNNGMARVPVFMIRQQTQENNWNAATGGYPVTNYGAIYIATHGRGIFMSDDFLQPLGINNNNTAVDKASWKPSINIYPNPVQSNSLISFNLSKPADAVVKIYNLQGKLVKTINLPHQLAGNNQFIFNSNDLSAGTYLINLSADEISTSAKFVVVK